MTTRTERRSTPRPAKESRHRAREAALQMLYQWEIGRASMPDVLKTFWRHEQPEGTAMSDELRAFAERLATGVTDTIDSIDPVIGEAAEHWRLERMNVMD